ncbi:ORF043 [Escherichia phage T5]|uniref:ORF043 n=1 Tax=Escherichia phage T5 TaxID=2695836 RepID=Q5DMQ1_BPT5|nr:ORF043 [Escherichia phage T5]
MSELRVPIAYVKGIKKDDNDDVRNFVIQTNIRFHQSGIPWPEIESNLYRLHPMIEPYIWGVLGTGEPNTITISDKDRLAAPGFDTVTSFRNMKR